MTNFLASLFVTGGSKKGKGKVVPLQALTGLEAG
jgi:hypothetical protein